MPRRAVLIPIAVNGENRAPQRAEVIVEIPCSELRSKPCLRPRIDNPASFFPVVAGKPCNLVGCTEHSPALLNAGDGPVFHEGLGRFRDERRARIMEGGG